MCHVLTSCQMCILNVALDYKSAKDVPFVLHCVLSSAVVIGGLFWTVFA